MKINILEIRDMVAQTVRLAMAEAKGRKVKVVPPQSEEIVDDSMEKKVRATGYSHAKNFDYSEPLGDANRAKRQGASSIGNWTSESRKIVTAEQKLRSLIRAVVAEEIRALRSK